MCDFARCVPSVCWGLQSDQRVVPYLDVMSSLLVHCSSCLVIYAGCPSTAGCGRLFYAAGGNCGSGSTKAQSLTVGPESTPEDNCILCVQITVYAYAAHIADQVCQTPTVALWFTSCSCSRALL